MPMVVDAPEGDPNFTMLISSKSETYVPEARQGWWGGQDTRTRCKLHGKVVFDQAGAERSAARATARGTRMHAYLGKCGHWHTSRTRG